MSARLVWITPDAEKHIAYCARVSNPTNQDNPDYAKLLRYCAKNAHHSVFEMASACVEIKCSRTIARQILRHRSFSFQEFSGRYAEMPEQPIFTEARRQDLKNRQNSIDDMEWADKQAWSVTQELLWNECHEAYQRALGAGIAKEVARSVLPEGMVQSTMYMSGTIRSWVHYLQVRLGNGTQKEHTDIARLILTELKLHIPTIIEAMELK